LNEINEKIEAMAICHTVKISVHSLIFCGEFSVLTKRNPGYVGRVSLFRRFADTNVAYTEPDPLKYGKLANQYPWIYGYVLQCVIML